MTLANNVPRYYWNPSRQQYELARTGEAISPSQIREWIDQTVAGSKARVRAISEQFVSGEINLPSWQTRVQAEIKGGHIAMAEIASGGKAQFTPTQAGRVGQRLRTQYTYLNQFGLGVEQGLIEKGPKLVARAELYAEGLRATYEGMRRGNMMDAGFEMERSILGAADSCDECAEQEAQDWVPIGTLVPIGERQCLVNCRCEMEYSMVKFEDGEQL